MRPEQIAAILGWGAYYVHVMIKYSFTWYKLSHIAKLYCIIFAAWPTREAFWCAASMIIVSFFGCLAAKKFGWCLLKLAQLVALLVTAWVLKPAKGDDDGPGLLAASVLLILLVYPFIYRDVYKDEIAW